MGLQLPGFDLSGPGGTVSSGTIRGSTVNSTSTTNPQTGVKTSKYTVEPVVDNSGSSGGGANVQDGSSGGGQPNILQPNYPAGSFDVTPFKQFYDQAYTELSPYYKQLLDEANGDLGVALQNLERDYQTGKRISVEDMTSAMSNLGATFPKEQTALQGGLNQRGIALTENPAGQTQYAGGGQAATEVGMLNTDQKLRAEAVKRTQNRSLESAAINKLTGSESSQQSFRQTTEAQQAQHESQAVSRGSQYQLADEASKQAGINKAEADAKTGGSGGSNVNKSGNWMDYYKGWNENAANADFNAVYGGNISKLQASKPL